MPEQDIPNFEVPEEELRFPEGFYLCALGGLKPLYSQNDPQELEAVTNDIWVLKFSGTTLNPANEMRIVIKDNNVVMGTHGVRIVERYPNPKIMPKLAWRMRAFFSKLDCITEREITVGEAKETKREVDWKKVREKYGTVFRMNVIYQKGKNGKNYRNIDYESLELLGQSISADHMKMIEEKYSALRALEESESSGGAPAETPPGLEDLPF